MSLRELYRAGDLPVLQNKIFHNQDAAGSSVGDVVLSQDTETGLVFNSAFDSSIIVYDSDYQNEQATSSVFLEHLDRVADIVDRFFSGKTVLARILHKRLESDEFCEY